MGYKVYLRSIVYRSIICAKTPKTCGNPHKIHPKVVDCDKGPNERSKCFYGLIYIGRWNALNAKLEALEREFIMQRKK
jgi:hypothetical protein